MPIETGEKLKVMLAVDHGSRPLLKFVCGRVMNAVRGDKLLLARHAGAPGSQVSLTFVLCAPQLWCIGCEIIQRAWVVCTAALMCPWLWW